MKFLSRRRGSALLISLAFLVIIAILVVGLAESMRLERSSSRTHLDRNRAMDFAQMGVERVVGQLHRTIANTNVNWVSSPGRITFSGSGGNTLTNAADLYSGLGNTNLTDPYRVPDLNARLLSVSGTGHLITDRTKDPADPASGVVTLPLQWIYVRQDGTLVTDEKPDLTDKTNSIVGRFAYWADDESSKINYNIAWKRSGSTSQRHSGTAVNLPSLPGMTVTNADAIHDAVTTDGYTSVSRFFNTPLDARHLGTNISALINSNKFETTHYNNDPDTTFFNEPRIVLTTQEKYAPKDSHGNLLKDANGAPYFLDILATPNTDPGILINTIGTSLNLVDSAKLNKTLNLLMRYMKNRVWPVTASTNSLQDKYYAGDPTRLPQLALNIIEYVRSKESSEPLVDSLRGAYTNGIFVPAATYTTGSFMGLNRTPKITELGAWIDEFGEYLKIKVEFYLPLNYGLSSFDIGAPHSLYIYFMDGHSTIIEREFSITPAECSTGTTTLSAGSYVTVTHTYHLNNAGEPFFSPRPNSISLRVAFSRLNLMGRTEICPLVTSPLIPVLVDTDVTPEAKMHSKEVDDSCVNKVPGNWMPSTSTNNNTFGGKNSICKVGTTPLSISPQQDTDSSGMITDASLYMPPPKGTPNNPNGLVVSTGELGYVHTGVESSSTNSVGVPWRTLRLQPNNYANTSAVPDWAFMDLFTVPTAIPTAGAPIFLPHGAAIGGRVNVNAQVQPFGNPSLVNIPLERIYPLKAVLEGISTNGGTLSAAQAETVARNISSHTLAANGKAYGNTNIYDSPGEVVEIAGVADGGEASEAIVRGIANLITSRGNVFSIYTIGQSLKQTPDGRLIVNGEQRIQAMVERYLDTSVSPSVVRFRSVYFRNLTP